MNVFYEEDGAFKVASIMSEAESSLQVESAQGKRSKIKAANVLMRFEGALQALMDAASQEAENLDTDFLWECAGEDEFAFDAFAQDYFGAKPTPVQAAAIAIKLHSAPMYFYRKGKGRYKAAPPETLKAALAGMEKKRLQAEQVAQWVAQMQSGQLPTGFTEKAQQLLYAPDKNSLEWKALDQAAIALGKPHLQLMADIGLLQNHHDYHLGAFLFEMFKHGTDFAPFDLPSVPELPFADVQAFSIDDATTTEIDDAFSFARLDNGHVRVGIHIAAPSLSIAANSPLDEIVRSRLSTVYMPGNKITMLPESVIRPFSLDEGQTKPALSLYCELDAEFNVQKTESRFEHISIAANLRHDSLEPHFNEATLSQDNGHAYWARLKYLFDWAEHLEKARGKYDPNRPIQLDYNFYVEDGKVRIVARHRGSPLDKLVAELMIFANSHWGGLLKDANIAGIYRAQTGGKVFMTSHAEPHQGLGVAQYAWCTSPLRRAVDLINQRQFLAMLNEQPPAYQPKDTALKVVIRDFDQTYNAYNAFQTRMERYWCLQYLIQESITETPATVWRENLVRIEGMFFIAKIPSLPTLKPGTRVMLGIEKIDTLNIELEAKYLNTLEEAPANDMTEQEIESELEHDVES